MSIKTKKERSVGTDIESLIEKIILERQPHWVKRALDAEAIATTLRAELEDVRGDYGLEVQVKRDAEAESRRHCERADTAIAERDTLARRVAELEVLVKCPREEDHLRIDALTAENGRLREELQYNKWFAERHNQHLESLNKADARIDELTALLRDMPVIHTASDDDWLARVDAALAGGGDSNE
jgi:hypothetical protein